MTDRIIFLSNDEVESLLNLVMGKMDSVTVQDAINSLILNYTPLALSIARRYHRFPYNGYQDFNEEINQISIVALIEAVNSFNRPSIPVKCYPIVKHLISYIKKRVRGMILDFMRQETENPPISLDYMSLNQQETLIRRSLSDTEKTDPFKIEIRKKIIKRFYEVLNTKIRDLTAKKIFITKTGLGSGKPVSYKRLSKMLDISERRLRIIFDSMCYVFRKDPILRDLIS